MTIGALEIEPLTGQLRITHGGRVVATTEGTLVCLLSSLQSFSLTGVEWPDPANKDYAYAYNYQQTRSVVGVGAYEADQYSQCQTIFGRRPQEYTAEQTLMVAPDGADIFVGQVRLTRTQDPSHTWVGNSLNCTLEQGAWHPWAGSALIEGGVGLSRALHIYMKSVSGHRELVLEREMSVSVGMGGYGSYGASVPGNSPDGAIDGVKIQFQTGASVPAWTSTSSPYKRQAQRLNVPYSSPTGPTDFDPCQFGGSQACSIVDPTDYTSKYDIDIRGYFGRRS